MLPWGSVIGHLVVMVTIWTRIKDGILFRTTLKKGKTNKHDSLIWIRKNGQTLMK